MSVTSSPFDIQKLVKCTIRVEWSRRWKARNDGSAFSREQRAHDVEWLRGAVQWLREQRR